MHGDGVCSVSRSLSVLGVGADVDYLEQFGASSVSAPPGACLEQPRATVTRRRARHFLSPDVHMSTRGQDLLRLAAPRPAGSLQSPWSAASSLLPPGLSTVLSRGSR